MKIIAIIQARMTSTRLPGKVLLPVLGRNLISLMLERIRRCRSLDGIWVACTTRSEDDPLEETVRSQGVDCHRGSEKDVLGRYVETARKADAAAVVRLTADCPLIDPELVDRVVTVFKEGKGTHDYVSNTIERTYPDGLDTEVFSREALDRADCEAVDPYFREHVTPYIHGHHGRSLASGDFRRGSVRGDADFSHLRWTVDLREDYERVKKIFEALLPHKKDFGWLDVVALQTRRPELLL